MQLCMLLQPAHYPVPKTITECANFGTETIMSGTERIRGTVTILDGPPHEFIKWLQPFDHIWASNAPQCGEWHVQHIQQDFFAVAGEQSYKVVDLITHDLIMGGLSESGANVIADSYNRQMQDVLAAEIIKEG